MPLIKRDFLYKYASLLVFPIMGMLLAAAIALDNPEVLRNRQAVALTYIEKALKGQGGFSSSGAGNRLSLAGLEKGDILLGGYDSCAYGWFSHAGIYVGNNLVVEGYVDLGICEQDIEHYWEYSKLCVLRVNAPQEVKNRAVDYVKKQKGELFYPMSFKKGERFWNCTKIMWKAYAVQGLELVEANDLWISPDALYQSPRLKIIREEGR